MNWAALAKLVLQLTLMAVPMVEKIAGDAMKGSSKKQLAMEGVQAALATSEAVDPTDADLAETAAIAADGMIDTVVAIGNKTGDLKKTKDSSPTKVAPTVSTVVKDGGNQTTKV